MYRQRVSKNQTISAAAWNNLVDEVNRQAKLTACPPLEVTDNGGGLSLRWVDTAVWAKLGEGDEDGQAWVEVMPDGEGGWNEVPDGRFGTVESNAAFEINGSPASQDSVVRIVPGFGEEYVYSAGGVASIMGLLYEKSTGGDWISYTFAEVIDVGTPTPLSYIGGNRTGTAYSESNIDIPVAPTITNGPSDPATTTNNSAIGDVAWSNAGNVTSSDDSYATASLNTNQTTQWLVVTGFGFSIPTDAFVLSIKVEVEAKASAATGVSDLEVYLNGDTVGTVNMASTADLGTSDAYRTYEAPPTGWGAAATATFINDTDFGVRLRYKSTNASSQTVSVDHVRITVVYAPEIAKDCVVRLRPGKDGPYWLLDYEPRIEIVRMDPDADPVSIDGNIYLPGWIMHYDQSSKLLVAKEDILIRGLTL